MKYDMKSRKLSELATYKTGRLNSNAAEENGKYPFFTTAPTTFTINTWSFDKEAVILGGNNANGNFTLKIYEGKFNAYQRTYVISVNENAPINNYYLFYALRLQLNILKGMSIGSATKFLTKPIIDNLEISYPSKYDDMAKLVTILKSLDLKIELNNQIISNLEELASTLFKRWFVDFEFPDEDGKPYKSSGGKMVDSELGKIPERWGVSNLTSVANYKNGLAMQKFRPTSEEWLPVLKIKELNQGFTDNNSDKCDVGIIDDVKVYDGDVIFSWSGTLLVKLWTGGSAGLNQHLFKVTSTSYSKWFYYLWTKYHLRSFIEVAKDKATTMGHIKRQHLEEAVVLVPDIELLENLNEVLSPIIDMIVEKGLEISNIETMRDNLLPKLLSGEVEISDAEVIKQ